MMEAYEDLGLSIRLLLACPVVHRSQEGEAFRRIAVQRNVLRAWFESNLGWRLLVDLAGGVARLHKRSVLLDSRRGLKRTRGTKRAFDPLRYQILCLACAQLLRRPHVTMGDLADSVERVTLGDEALMDFETTRHAHRLAFVDVLLWMQEMRVLEVTAGRVEGYSATEQGDAVLKANTSVIPMLLSCETPPSRVVRDELAQSPAEWTMALSRESRHTLVEQDPDSAHREQRNQWARQRILRRLLDDPVMDLQELSPIERQYLQSPSGRDKVLKVVAQAGLLCERHVDTWLAIDPTLESSDAPALFGAKSSVAQQTACVLMAGLASSDENGARHLLPRSIKALEAELESQWKRYPQWAKGARKAGAASTCRDALELLAEFGLISVADGQVHPRPAASRFEFEVS